MLADPRPFDADDHDYEPLDAFTRHLDPEGLVAPLDYSADLQGFKPEVQQKIRRDNTVALTQLAPA